MFSILNRFKKPWRTEYLEEVAEELEVLRRNLVELQHFTRVVQGKIAAFEETAKSHILRPEEGHRNLRGSVRGSSEQAGTACDATSVASGQLACEVQQGPPHQPLPTAMLSGG